MGGGSWDVDTSHARTAAKAAAGKSAFDYHDDYRAGRVTTVSPLVDPKIVAGDTSPHAGQVMREVMISDEHPNPTAMAVLFDVTGSMGRVPRVLQQKLPQLHGLIQRKGYVQDPQILFGAIGDAFSDRFPLQVGQFESDNRMDEQLEATILEGGGGGGNHESYELGAYFLARHTYLEPYEKQGRKGYVFFIGDERLYDKVDRRQVEKLIGDTLQEDISTEEIFAELQERYEVFMLFAAQGSYQPEGVLYEGSSPGRWDRGTNVCYWRDLIGQNALVLEDADAVCEFIAMQMATAEAGISVDEAMEDMLAIGADPNAVKAAGKALATVGGGGSVVAQTTEGGLPDVGTDSGSTRL